MQKTSLQMRLATVKRICCRKKDTVNYAKEKTSLQMYLATDKRICCGKRDTVTGKGSLQIIMSANFSLVYD